MSDPIEDIDVELQEQLRRTVAITLEVQEAAAQRLMRGLAEFEVKIPHDIVQLGKIFGITSDKLVAMTSSRLVRFVKVRPGPPPPTDTDPPAVVVAEAVRAIDKGVGHMAKQLDTLRDAQNALLTPPKSKKPDGKKP